jgi:hypothetical protein
LQIRLGAPFGALLLLCVPGPAIAQEAATSMFPLATTDLLSRSHDGGVPNGPSRNAAFSRDARYARVVAFESDASNVVPGDANGLTDVFLVRRADPYGEDGSRWKAGATELASTGLDGQPANGPSYRPVLDGGPRTPPACLAFVSEASNLVPGDTNGVADAFVRNLHSGQITRVSVGSSGQQANGPTFEVTVDGDCGRVAFSSNATNLALTRTRRKGWLSAKTSTPPQGTRQVYVRMLATAGPDRRLRGLTFLASASNRGSAGNGDSGEPALAGNGKSVAFSSTATNLAPGDGSAASDVYQRTMIRQYRRFRRGPHQHTLLLSTRLVSATHAGSAGNGPSSHPSATDDGRYVAFETQASNLVSGDGNGTSDVVRADMAGSPPGQLLISKTQSAIGNGPSNRPVITGAGNSVLFDSDASNLKMFPTFADDANGVRDVFIGVVGHKSASRESLNAQSRPALAPSENPATSTHNNYLAFESTDRLLDPSVPNVAGERTIYLRYLGPK